MAAVNFPTNPQIDTAHEENGVSWICTHINPTRWAKTGDKVLDDYYLGTNTVNPTIDNRGQPLIVGMFYWNTTDNELRVYSNVGWVAPTTDAVLASVAAQAALNDVTTLSNLQAMQDLYNALNVSNGVLNREVFTATAGQTVFTIAGGYTVGSIDVYKNGLKLTNGVEVDVSTGTTIVLTLPALLSDTIETLSFSSFSVANTYSKAQVDSLLTQLQFDLGIGL